MFSSFVLLPLAYALMWLMMGGGCVLYLCWGVRQLRRGRRAARACADCGYPRSGLPSGVCPECGSTIGPGEVKRHVAVVPVFVVYWAFACWQLWYQVVRLGYIIDTGQHRAAVQSFPPGWRSFDYAYAWHAVAAVAALWLGGLVFAATREPSAVPRAGRQGR